MMDYSAARKLEVNEVKNAFPLELETHARPHKLPIIKTRIKINFSRIIALALIVSALSMTGTYQYAIYQNSREIDFYTAQTRALQMEKLFLTEQENVLLSDYNVERMARKYLLMSKAGEISLNIEENNLQSADINLKTAEAIQ